MDYTFQRLYLDTALHNPGANGRFPHRTMLQPVPDAAPGGATWRPLYAQLPWQYGINLVELQPEAGAGEAALEFRGLAEGGAADGSGWRVTLVAHDGGACGVLPSQSATAVVTSESAAGTGTPTAVLRVPLRPEHTHMTLAVAACPTQYLPLGFRRGLQLKRAYPYEVHGLCGCRPATPEECWGHGGSGPLPPGGAHANGGGFVASSAHAETTAYVAPGARVLEGARLVGHARAEGHAVVKGRGMVGGHAVVSDWAVVEGEAIVQGNAAVRDFGRVSSRARVEGTARVYDFAAVSGDGTVRGQAVAQRRWGHSLEEGNGKLYGDPHFREMNGRYMEQVWSYFEGQLGVPMPFTSSPPPFLEVSAVLNDWLQERGGELQLVGSKRELFGDRWPGLPTQLAVEYTVGCAGQEAERHTCCVADEEPLELVSVPGVMEVKVVRAEYRPARPKVNVYISNTGLPKHRSGWAFGGRDMMLSPGAMLEGSSVLPHEFGHVMQTHLQGFTLSGGSQPVVGWIWESHANWASHQFVPSYAPVLEWWLARCHYELTSTRHNYGSWLFLQHLLEHSGAPSDFCFRFWQENRKDGRGNSVEDPLQTVMRCGAELGIFPAHDPVGGFGDMIGDMAARMVTMDYTFQRLYLDT
eukprot:gene11741-13865_t